ncbi:hypothetical protein ABKN59_007405 [Abortiporus biennis]
MALNYDVFDHIQSYITCRKDLLASMMTCRMLYNSGIPYLLRHFPIALTNYISIESFCRFMLSDPTRFLLFHRLQLKFDTYDSEDNESTYSSSRWDLDEEDGLADTVRNDEQLDCESKDVLPSTRLVHHFLKNARQLEELTLDCDSLYSWFQSDPRIPALIAELPRLKSLHLLNPSKSDFIWLNKFPHTIVSLSLWYDDRDEEPLLGRKAVQHISVFRDSLESLQFILPILSVHWDPTLSFRRLKELWIQSMNYISAEDLIRLFPNVERMAIVGNWDYPINRDASNLWHAINREAFQNDSQAWGSLSHLWGNSRELFCLAYPRQVNNLSIQKLEDTPNLSRTQYILHCFQPKCLQIVVCTFHTPPFEGTSTLTLLVDLILSMENSDAWKRLRKLCIIIRVRPKFDLMTDFRNTNPDFSKIFKNLSITHVVIKVAIDRNDAPWHISPPIEVADLDLSKEFPAKWLAGRILRDAKSTLEYLNISLHYVDNSVDAELSSYIPLITRFWKIVQGRDKRQLQEIPISVGEKFMHVDGFQFGLPGVITSWL